MGLTCIVGLTCTVWLLCTRMINLPGKATVPVVFDKRLAAHVRNQSLDGLFRFLTVGLALEVDGYERTLLYEGMCQEHLQEETQLLRPLLKEGRLHVAKNFLLWETWRAIGTANLTLDH